MPEPVCPLTFPDEISYVADGLGQPGYPVGLGTPDTGAAEHVMGVTTLAWLTRFAVDRWGDAWATSGTIDVRFRAEVTPGQVLTITVDGDDGDLVAEVGDDTTRHLSARIGLGPRPPAAARRRATPGARVHPTAATLDGLALGPLGFTFDADRDLAFVAGLPDRVWVVRRWAHPAWLASAANAVLVHHVELSPPVPWLQTGLAVSLHAPVPDGARCTIQGTIDTLFDGRELRFAVAHTDVLAGGVRAATIRNTFSYARIDG